jgi:uncharacterized protein YllA (UPF0747 family)
MNFDEAKINELIEREIAKQINKKLDGAIERIVTREVNKTLKESSITSWTAQELIKSDKEFRKDVGKACARELYNNLTNNNYDDYDNEDDLDWN